MLKSIFPLTEVLQPQWKSSLEPIAEMQLESSKLIKVCQLVLLLEYQSHLVQSLSSNQLHPPSQEMRLSALKLLVNTIAGMRNPLLVCILHPTTFSLLQSLL